MNSWDGGAGAGNGGKTTVENINEAVIIGPWSSPLRHVLNETF